MVVPEKTPSLMSLYGGLWQYGKGRRLVWILALGMMGVSESVRLLVPWFAGLAVNAVQRGGAGVLATAGGWGLAIVGVILGAWALHGPARIIECRTAQFIRANCAAVLTDKLLDAPLAWHRGQNSAETAQRLSQSSTALYEFAQAQYQYLQNTISLIGPIVALWVIAPVIGLMATVGYGVIGVLSKVFDRALVNVNMRINQAERRYGAALFETFGNIETVCALKARSGMAGQVRKRLMTAFLPAQRMFVLNELRWASIDSLAILLWLAIVSTYVGISYRSAGGGLALGSLFMVNEYARRTDGVLAVFIDLLGKLNSQLAGHAAAMPIEDVVCAPRIERPAPSRWLSLQLRDVSLRRGDHDVLQGTNLRLRRGRRYALVGPSGCGKSSLLQVLSGLELPTSGDIVIDGVLASAVRLQMEATLIPQRATLFEGTIADNLTLGRTVSEGRIIDALKLTQAWEWVTARDQGLATFVSQDGNNWSGGQLQRLALARGVVVAQMGSLVLFDEPSSSLDSDVERKLFDALLRVFDDACVVVAVHGLHLLPLFDEVIVMSEGRILEVRPAGEQVGRGLPASPAPQEA